MHHYRCQVCNRVIHGRAHHWAHRIMCASCHRYFSRHVSKTSTIIKRLGRSKGGQQQRENRSAGRSWFQRLFG